MCVYVVYCILQVNVTIYTYYMSCVCAGYFHDGLLLHFVASMISGLITTAASMPVDIAKTRYTLHRTPVCVLHTSLGCVLTPSHDTYLHLTPFTGHLTMSCTLNWAVC